MNTSEIVAYRGSQSLAFLLIMQEDGGTESKQLKCQEQGQNRQAQCTLNKPIFCPNKGETLVNVIIHIERVVAEEEKFYAFKNEKIIKLL